MVKSFTVLAHGCKLKHLGNLPKYMKSRKCRYWGKLPWYFLNIGLGHVRVGIKRHYKGQVPNIAMTVLGLSICLYRSTDCLAYLEGGWGYGMPTFVLYLLNKVTALLAFICVTHNFFAISLNLIAYSRMILS